MADGEEGSVATNGRWGGCVGPQSFFWGGTWICAAAGTDNTEIVADIMRQLTCNADIMKDIVTECGNVEKLRAELAPKIQAAESKHKAEELHPEEMGNAAAKKRQVHRS